MIIKPVAIASAVVISFAGPAAFLVMPLMVGATASDFQLSAAQMGYLVVSRFSSTSAAYGAISSGSADPALAAQYVTETNFDSVSYLAGGAAALSVLLFIPACRIRTGGST